MLLAEVIGHVVATAKHGSLEGSKMLLVRPISPDGQADGEPLMAVDAVGAGVGERVLVVVEGRSAGEAVRMKESPLDAAIVGIVDSIKPA